MNGPAREDILAFIERSRGRRLAPFEEADILGTLGIDGKDAAEFLQAFAKEFKVDLTGLEPAFHFHEEDRRMRPGWPLPLTHVYGVRLPIGVGILVRAAQTGRWPPVYPLLKPAASVSWLNAPIVLVGLPLIALIAIALVRMI